MAGKKPKHIGLNKQELEAFKKRISQRDGLCEKDYRVIEVIITAVETLTRALENKRASVTRLARYLFGAPTETAKNVLDSDEPAQKPSQTPRKPSPGHGRNGAAAHHGAHRVALRNEQMQAGSHCPDCLRGTLYELALPATTIHFEGCAPVKSTVYELERLRCNACGKVFTADAPEGCQQKYADSATAMVAILKYGCGMPFYRLGKLQEAVGMPLAPSSQWEIVDDGAEIIRPVFDALLIQAAQGTVIHNDDTTMRVLQFLREQDPESERKGIFTTGIVSLSDQHRIAIFFTGHRHAGENLEELLRSRAKALEPPIQMCDALSRNAPREFRTILCNCLTHARRQFIDVMDSFPDECGHVIRQLAVVYQNDDLARKQAMTPDERPPSTKPIAPQFSRNSSNGGKSSSKTAWWNPARAWEKPSSTCSGIGKSSLGF